MCKKPTISQEKVNLLTAFCSLQKHLFPSLMSDSFWCFTSCLIIASTEQFLAYKVGLISGAFYEILGNKDQNEFLNHVIYSIALLLSITLFKSLRSFLSKTLGVLWRKHLTKSVHEMYFNNLTFYKLISFGKCVLMYHKSDDKPKLVLPWSFSYSLWENFTNSTVFHLSTQMKRSPISMFFHLHKWK